MNAPGPMLLGLASIARDGGFRRDSLRSYGGESQEKILLRPGDLFVALKDVTQAGLLLGAAARVPDDLPLGRLTQDTLKLIPKSDAVPMSYLYWLLRTPQHRTFCRSHALGTTNLSLSREDFLALPVPAFTPERREFVAVLDMIEQAIELNSRLGDTIERIAEAAFRSRFIDFDLAEDLVESEVGWIPRGWRSVPFSQAVEVNPRVPISRGTEAPFVEMAALPRWGTRPTELRSREFAGSGARFEIGDTIMARITGCIEHGKGAFVDFVDQAAFGSTEYLVFRARPPLTPEVVFLLSRSDLVRSFAIGQMTGSSGRQRVPADSFDHLMIPVPPDAESWRADAELLRRCFQLSKVLWQECRSLCGLREGLLPKLISGSVSLPIETSNRGAV